MARLRCAGRIGGAPKPEPRSATKPAPRRGGRVSVRKSPYMATVTAIRAFHTRLCRQRLPKKVALVAALRQLLLTLNAVLRDQIPWQKAPVSTVIKA